MFDLIILRAKIDSNWVHIHPMLPFCINFNWSLFSSPLLWRSIRYSSLLLRQLSWFLSTLLQKSEPLGCSSASLWAHSAWCWAGNPEISFWSAGGSKTEEWWQNRWWFLSPVDDSFWRTVKLSVKRGLRSRKGKRSKAETLTFQAFGSMPG